MKSLALVLVNSSFQLMCAMEYLLSQSYQNDVMIVTSEEAGSTTCKQMLRLAKDFGINSIDSVTVLSNGSLERRIGSYGEYFAKSLRGKEFEYLLIGDVRHQWIQDYTCSVKAKKVVMVDDGGAVFSIIKYILEPLDFTLPMSSTVVTTDSRRVLATQLKNAYGMVITSTPVKLFSIFYQEAKSHITRNQYQHLCEFYNPRKGVETINEIHVIGAPFVEHNLLSQDDYLDYISSLNALNKNYTDAKLVYFMHRFEQDNHEKCLALRALGFELRQSDINYELTLIQSATKPLAVGSIISTSLYNVKALFGEQVEAVFVPLKTKHLDFYQTTHWMVKQYTLSQHWQHIIDNFPRYSIVPISQWVDKYGV
jgi:hypothetical protein